MDVMALSIKDFSMQHGRGAKQSSSSGGPDGSAVESEGMSLSSVDSGHPERNLLEGIYQWEEGELDFASSSWRMAAEQGSVAGKYLYAVDLFWLGRRADAESVWAEIRDERPGGIDRIDQQALLALIDPEEFSPKIHSADYCALLGFIASGLGEEATAERLWLNAAYRGDWESRAALAHYYQEQGRSADAAQWFTALADAGDWQAMVSLAEQCEMEGDLEDAEEWLNKASAESRSYFLELAAFRVRNGDLGGAREALGQVGEGWNQVVAYWYGVIADEEGDLESAKRWWLRSAEGDFRLSFLELAGLSERNGDLEEASLWRQRAREDPLP